MKAHVVVLAVTLVGVGVVAVAQLEQQQLGADESV